jgi:hypothetical protein
MRDICIRNAVAFSCPKLASLVELPLKRPDLVATPTGIPEVQVVEAKSRGRIAPIARREPAKGTRVAAPAATNADTRREGLGS